MTLHTRDPVATIARRAPVVTAADETLRAVAHTLWTESVGALVVGDARHPVGVARCCSTPSAAEQRPQHRRTHHER